MTFYVGVNSTIKCDVGGTPVPSVTWEGVNGTSLDENMVVSDVMGRNLPFSLPFGGAAVGVCQQASKLMKT